MESIKELRKICHRPKKGVPIVSRICRFFSIYFTWFFLHFKKFTPNQLTIAGTIIFIIGIFCYIKGEYWLNLLGVSFIWLSIILDYSDGEMARYRKTSRVKGVWIESLTHDIKYAILFVPLALGAYSSFSYPALLFFLAFSASMFRVLFRLTMLRYINMILPHQSEESYRKIGEKAFYSNKKLRRIFSNLGGTTEIIAWLSLATILDKVYLVVIFYGILFPLVYLVLLFKQYKGIKALKHE